MSTDDVVKLLKEPGVERVELRPDGTVIVEKARVVTPSITIWPQPYYDPYPPNQWYTITSNTVDTNDLGLVR